MNGAAEAIESKSPPVEPVVAEASNEATEGLGAISVPKNWVIELFAAEPLVANVVAIDIDHKGRVFLCETFRQNRGVTDNRGHDDAWLMADLSAKTVQDRIDYHHRLLGEAAITYAQHDDRIRRLEDIDGDGKADSAELFANGFNKIEEGTGAGILVRGATVYYTCIPRLWKFTDADDNGVADDRVALSDGYGVRVAFRGHDMHGLIKGPDGRIYFSIGDRGYHITTKDDKLIANPAVGAVFRCETDGSGLELFCEGLRNPQELAFNDRGDWFTVDNNSDSGDKAKVFQLLQEADYGWRMHYQYLPTRGPYNEDRLWEPLHAEQPFYIVPPIANLTDGPSGLAYYPGTGFGDELKDKFLICDFRGTPSTSGVRTFGLKSKGAFYDLVDDAKPVWSVLCTDVAFGPDGGMYVSDWVDGWDGVGKGRIYRVTHPEHRDSKIVTEVAKILSSDWTKRETKLLVEDLSHVDRRVRLEGQWELANRGDVASLLAVASDTEKSPVVRLHGIWGADQIARLDPEKSAEVLEGIRPLLVDSSEIVVAGAAHVVGDRGFVDTANSLVNLIKHESSKVRYAAVMSLAKIKSPIAMDAVVEMLEANNNSDPVLRHAGQIYFARTQTPEAIAKLSTHENESVRRSAVVALRESKSGEISRFLADESMDVVLEAARAIHDEPVTVAMGSLAALIEKPFANVPLLRRIVNSNYRMGTPESALALAKLASRNTTPESMRIEALDCLMNWGSTDPRDRVLNEVRALGEHNLADAATALTAEIEPLLAANEAVREKAIEAAAKLQIVKIAPALVARVADADQKPSSRASAIRGLAKLDPSKAVMLAKEVKLLPPNSLVEAAIETLAEFDLQGSTASFVTATESRSISIQQLGWSSLAKSSEPKAIEAIVKAVDKYLAGTLPAEVQLDVLEAAEKVAGRKELPEGLMGQVEKHRQSIAEKSPLGQWLVAIEGGDSASGKKLFGKAELSCVRCHKVDRAGGEVGPNLTTIGKDKDRRYLLEAICLPDASIAKGFETAVIADEDGNVATGIVKIETDEYVDLIQGDGTIVRVSQDVIVARRKGKSAMPEDLIKHLSMRELRDLVAYLSSLKVDPRAKTEVE